MCDNPRPGALQSYKATRDVRNREVGIGPLCVSSGFDFDWRIASAVLLGLWRHTTLGVEACEIRIAHLHPRLEASVAMTPLRTPVPPTLRGGEDSQPLLVRWVR